MSTSALTDTSLFRIPKFYERIGRETLVPSRLELALRDSSQEETGVQPLRGASGRALSREVLTVEKPRLVQGSVLIRLQDLTQPWFYEDPRIQVPDGAAFASPTTPRLRSLVAAQRMSYCQV
jgi:hypothetical protein